MGCCYMRMSALVWRVYRDMCVCVSVCLVTGCIDTRSKWLNVDQLLTAATAHLADHDTAALYQPGTFECIAIDGLLKTLHRKPHVQTFFTPRHTSLSNSDTGSNL
jgi:hypothetical protein